MNIGTRRGDGTLITLGAKAMLGMVTRAGATGAARTAAVVSGADGVDGAACVGVDDERLGVVEVMESEGSCCLGTDAGSGADRA